jgi:2-oxoisovalerate dehydrogenase E1 component beta subunit
MTAEAQLERGVERGVTMVEAIRDALREEMRRDGDVVLLGEDVGVKGGVFKATEGLHEEFGPRRVLDTPIAEEGIAGTAIGAAMMGLRPVAEFQFADYIFPAFDQIVNQAATVRWRSVGGFGVPAVFRAPSGSGVRGGVYHSQNVEALFCHTPGLKVVTPATARDAKGLLKAAIRDDDPVVFLEHKKLYRRERELVPPDEVLPLGRARLEREGSHVSILTYGVGVHHAREVAGSLAAEGIEVEVLDLRTLAPLDTEAIAGSVRKTGRALILHEANRTMGIGAEIAAFLGDELFWDLDAPIRRLAGADSHLPYNAPEEDAVIPNPRGLAAAVRELASR